jgi:hypothetical protein
MQQVPPSSNIDNNRLRRLRRRAGKHQLKIKGVRRGRIWVHGRFSLVTASTRPPRGVEGLTGVPLAWIENALPPARQRHELTSSEVDALIQRIGADRALASIDRLTAPAQPIAAE